MSSLKRVLQFAVKDFFRNKGMSIAAIFVLTVTTLLVTGLFYVHGVSAYLVDEVKNKIDITAYFKAEATEQDILGVKGEIIQNNPTVKNVVYVSPEDALQDFMQKHSDNSDIAQALSEVGDNPFLPSLNITTDGDPKQYEAVSNTISQSKHKDLVEKVDFYQKKDIIEKVFSIISSINLFGLIAGVLLVLIAMLVVFNTIKLIVDSSRDEISTMRIVGASSWFIRAPFILEGMLFGLISFLICISITLLASYALWPALRVIMPGFNLFAFFLHNFFWIILLQLFFGMGLGAISSYIVVRKYLEV